MKSKSCTKKCERNCLANPANHIPHEHFIVAFSFLVIALSGIITTTATVDAAKVPTKKKIAYIASCIDPDKRNIATKGTTAITRYEKLNRTNNSTVSSKTDSCVNAKSVREYLCSGGKITSVVSKCPKNYSCFNGACITLLNTAVTTVAPLVSDAPSSTAPSSTPPRVAPADSNVIIGSDGTWCNLHSSPDSIYYAPTSCEDSTGAKVASTCGGDNLSAYSCDYTYDGSNYHNVKCKQYVQPCSWISGTCTTNYCKLSETQTGSSLPNPTISCSDSDNGTNADVNGTISIKNSGASALLTASDTCLSDDTLTELFCDNNAGQRYASTTISCESGICSDGACVTLTSP